MPSPVEGLKPFALLGGYDAAELWPTINLVLPAWLLLVFAPRWRHTQTLTLIPPLIHAAIYALSAASLVLFSDGGDGKSIDMSTLEGVVALFKDPNGVFVGWVHYVVYDLLIARMIVRDSVERGASVKFHAFAMVPILFLALALGPSGWLSYMIVRTVFLPSPVGGDKAKQK